MPCFITVSTIECRVQGKTSHCSLHKRSCHTIRLFSPSGDCTRIAEVQELSLTSSPFITAGAAEKVAFTCRSHDGLTKLTRCTLLRSTHTNLMSRTRDRKAERAMQCKCYSAKLFAVNQLRQGQRKGTGTKKRVWTLCSAQMSHVTALCELT